jgi:hypothetical protein
MVITKVLDAYEEGRATEKLLKRARSLYLYGCKYNHDYNIREYVLCEYNLNLELNETAYLTSCADSYFQIKSKLKHLFCLFSLL